MAGKWSYKQLLASLAALAVTVSVLIGSSAGPAGASVSRSASERVLSESSVCGSSASSDQASVQQPHGTEPTSNASGVKLPKDEAPHHADDEWWYFSGHIIGVDPSGHLHCYGFEYVTFQFLHEAPEPVYFGDLSITDLTRGTFQYGVKEASYPYRTPRQVRPPQRWLDDERRIRVPTTFTLTCPGYDVEPAPPDDGARSSSRRRRCYSLRAFRYIQVLLLDISSYDGDNRRPRRPGFGYRHLVDGSPVGELRLC